MSDDVVIKIETLGKKYRITHQAEPQNYVALRDILARKGRTLIRTPWTLMTRMFHPNGRTRSPKSEDFWALRNVSFEVRRGEVVGIIGRNGAGKSTLLKILSRITEPTEGRVEVEGSVASLLEVGTGFHPELTGRENIFLNGAILGMRKAEICDKFDEIVAFAEVENFLDMPVKRYSSGMYVRLAFGVAAHLNPEILIVDEVLAVGDAQFQKKCLGKMQNVARGGRTVLFVSHNMNVVQQLCTRGILLRGGTVEFNATAIEAVERYMKAGRSAGLVNLSERVDRTGDGRIRFRDVTVLSNGKEVVSVGTGEAVEVLLTFRSTSPQRVRSLRFGISLVSASGIEFVSFDSASVGFSRQNIPRTGVVRCCIPSLPVVRGLYTAWVYAAINGQIGDRVENAFELEVTGGQFPKMGFFAVKHEWEIEERPSTV